MTTSEGASSVRPVDPQEVIALLSQCHSFDDTVRESAMSAIEKLEKNALISVLSDLLHSDISDIRADAAEAPDDSQLEERVGERPEVHGRPPRSGPGAPDPTRHGRSVPANTCQARSVLAMRLNSM